MKEVLILLYWLLSFLLIRHANRLWKFKAISRLQDIQLQVIISLLWLSAVLCTNQGELWIGWGCLLGAVGYKFWVDFRLWQRAASGIEYPCVVAKSGIISSGYLWTLMSSVPVVIVKCFNGKIPSENEYYWCRVLKFSFFSAKVEVELLSKMDWGEKEAYFAAKRIRDKRLKLANFFNSKK